MFASLVYTKPVRKLLYQFKYKPYVSDLTNILSELFIEGLIQKEAFMTLLTSDIVLVPIPLHIQKYRERGYNHAELLAASLGKYFHLPVENILVRQKQTVSQFGLTREQRKENLKKAFVVSHKGQCKTVMLIDDIVTSGTTFSEAANVLKRSGVSSVYGIALAHGK